MLEDLNVYQILLALLIGVAMGVLYFGGLWLTVKKVFIKKKTAMLFSISFIIRLLVVFGGFYYAISTGWIPALLCLTGFFITRKILTIYKKPGEREMEL